MLSLAVVACSPLLLGQVLIERFDVLPAAFTAAALAASVRGHYRVGGAMLGLGAAAKIYPALLIPVLAIAAFRQRGRGEALWVAGIAVAAAVAVVLPFAVASPSDTWNSLQVQFRGGLQIEALASSVLVLTSHAADAMDVRPFETRCSGRRGRPHPLRPGRPRGRLREGHDERAARGRPVLALGRPLPNPARPQRGAASLRRGNGRRSARTRHDSLATVRRLAVPGGAARGGKAGHGGRRRVRPSRVLDQPLDS